MAVIRHFHVHLLPSNKGRYYCIKCKHFYHILSYITRRFSSSWHFHTCILFCFLNSKRYSITSKCKLEMCVADLCCGNWTDAKRTSSVSHNLTGFMCESGFVSFPTLCACLYALSGVAMMQIVSCPYVKTISPTKNGNSLPIMAC